MKPLHALLATTLAACGSTSPRGPDSPRRPVDDACARLVADTLRAVTAQYPGADDGPTVGQVIDALGPYGRCSDPTPAGRWGLVFGDDLEIGTEAIEDLDTGEHLGTAVWVRAFGLQPLFVTRTGEVIKGRDFELPRLDLFIGPDGNEYFPPWPHDSETVDLALDTDWSGDGEPEALVDGLGGTGPLVVLQVAGDAIRSYPPAAVLPFPTAAPDFDRDGRRDLADDAFFAFDIHGDVLHLNALQLVAHARADGTFTPDDAATRRHYREACLGLGRSPWLLGRDVSASLTNVACAWLHGTPTETILSALDAEARAQPDDAPDPNPLLTDQLADVRAWLDRPRPVTIGRDDGRRVVPFARASAASSLPPWKGYTFDPALAIDGDLGTSWQPKKATGAPWIELTFAAPTTITALEIGNGFQRNDALGDLFAMNRRALRVTVSAPGLAPMSVDLDPDRRDYHLVELPAPLTTTSVRLTITATTESLFWKNVALSEIRALAGP